MATVNLGRIKPVFRGAYDNSTAYVIDDIVTSGNETFIAIAATQGNATSDASKWTKLAAKGTDGTDLTTTLTTQGDLVYRDGSGLQRLAAGTSGQVLQTGGAGANPSWTTPATGGAISSNTLQIQGSFSTTSTSYVSLSTPLSITVTPSSTSSKFLLLFDGHSYISGGYIEMNAFKNSAVMTGSAGHFWRSNLSNWHPVGLHILDAPNTTSSITYELKIRVTAGTGYIGDGNNYTNQFSVIEL